MEDEKERLSTVLMSAIPALMSKVRWACTGVWLSGCGHLVHSP